MEKIKTRPGDPDREQTIEKIELLVRSPTRIRILETLDQHGRLDKHELRSQFDVARTTVQRNLSVLADHGWIEHDNGGCSLRPGGERIISDLSSLLDTVQTLEKLKPVMKWLRFDKHNLDFSMLDDADVYLPESGNPYAMINRHVELLKDMDRARAILPLTGLHAHEVGHRQITRNGAEVELVVARNVAETHKEDPNYEELTKEMLNTDQVEYYRYDESLPFGLAIIDGTVQIIVNEDNEPRAMVETDGEEARTWANNQFERYKQESELVS